MLEGVANARDVGGIPTAHGTIRSGVLLRSAALFQLTGTGRRQLQQLGVGTVVDLRTLEEGPPDDLPGIDLVRLPLLQGAMDPSQARRPAPDGARPDQVPTLAALYAAMIADGSGTFATLARIVATSSAPVLVHCTMGKDRTGVTVAVMLDAVGADRSAVIADYTASQANLAGPWSNGVLARLAEAGVPQTPELVELVTGSPATAIVSVLDAMDAAGGSLRFLTEHGLTGAEAGQLRERLVEA